MNIKGMHCRSCELIIEDELSKVHNVKSVVISQSKGTAEIEYEGELDQKAVEKAVLSAGYTLGKDDKSWFSRNKRDYRDLAIAIFIALDIFFVAKGLGLFHLNLVSSNNYNSLPAVFLIGLTAGVSTCMALIGGLILGASAKYAEKHPNASFKEKFKPHIFFNLGRIISYTFFGGIVGFLGSFFQLSSSLLGILIVAVGGVMLLLGAQLVDIFPKLRGISFTLPKEISRFFGIKEQSQKEYSHQNAAVLGATTFFLPCAFTQAMVLFAMGSGSAITGALTLGTFALGTIPGLLGIGSLTSVVKGTVARLFFKTAGIVVISLALFNIQNGYNLSGINLASVPTSIFTDIFLPENVSAYSGGSNDNLPAQNGVQIINMTQDGSGYRPNSFTLKRGVPVRWIINSTDPYNCAASIVSPQLNIRKTLTEGENIIEFTPTETGNIRFTCSMGMFTGSFIVVDTPSDRINGTVAGVQVTAPSVTPSVVPKTSGGSCGKSGGCGCGGGAAKIPQPVVAATPQEQKQDGDVQVIKATYTYNEDIRPNSFTLKAGKLARFEVEAKDNGQGCMGSITVPGLTDKVDILTAGKTTVFEFTPKTGNYQITCAMGVPRGQITVN